MVACIHHWVLPEPDGPTCVGVCKKCGARKTFSNSTPDALDKVYARNYGAKNVGRRRKQKDGAHKFRPMALRPKTVCVER